jgi:D-alanyl-lipoteichoic acid acyltransferase DltB (MBOAT superfamily)
MLFTSFTFALFFAVIFVVYWFILGKSHVAQNIFLVLTGYVFYGWWDWRLTILLFLVSISNYLFALKIDRGDNHSSKGMLWLALVFNIGILAFFKYFNFFIDPFINVLSSVGISAHRESLRIVLPIGLSFYIFQALGYCVDVYRKNVQAQKNPVVYFAFMSFFPQLIAGPIERASNMFPQYAAKRVFNYGVAVDGLRQILWGLFKKVVIANTCAIHADKIFQNYSQYDGITLFTGLVFYAFQIYCDFSGYSDIAIGSGKLLGIRIMANFKYPYFSKSIADFWRNWHISLTSWLRDMIFTPLVIKTRAWGKTGVILAVLLTYFICGVWHGATLNYAFWGVLNGIYFIPQIIFPPKKRKKNKSRLVRIKYGFLDGYQILLTFLMVMIAWLFFRLEHFHDAFAYLSAMVSRSYFALPSTSIRCGLYIAAFVFIEWVQKKKEFPLQIERVPLIIRWLIYLLLTIAVLGFSTTEAKFIYFQF